MIELYVFIQLSEMGISNQKIFTIRQQIAKDLQVPYPFATQGILTNGKNIWYEHGDMILDSNGTKQTNLIKILKTFAKKIEFSSDRMAEKFYPVGKKKSIVVSPHHQFGLPVIDGTNINTDTISSLYGSGEKIETISLLYDLSIKQIKDTISFSKTAA